jgi:hypothetical protein
MRLEKIKYGQSWLVKLRWGVRQLLRGYGPDDMDRLLRYRSQYYGQPFGVLRNQVLLGPSAWSPAERQLLGTFVSHQNRCPF